MSTTKSTDAPNIASNLASYIQGFSPRARDIFDKFEFEAEIAKLDEANRLYLILQEFQSTAVDLSPARISNLQMGYLFEELVRKFNEQANEEAGDHFTPREVIRLMVNLVFTGEEDVFKPGIYKSIYDPTAGTGGMLSVSEEFIKKQNPQANLALFGQKRVPETFIKDFRVGLPSVNEQQAITRFLDHKTKQIDALIVKKQALLDKLAEERAALISHTVTKGLDPTAETRKSMVPWLGDIPAHWQIMPLKYLCEVGNGSTPSRDNIDYWTDDGYPWLNSSVVNQECVNMADQFVTQLALKECHLPIVVPPAVLVGITGEGKTRGMATTLMMEATINQHLAYAKPNDVRLDVRYLRRVFDRAYAYLRNESDGGGSTKGAITCDQIANLKIPLPPVEEQKDIAEAIDNTLGRINQLGGKVERAIERLLEYRSSLITHAITGQIDVRHVPIPEPAHA